MSAPIENHLETKLFCAESALSLLSDDDFIDQWRNLATHCSWATAFQSPEYVQTWYRFYHERYEPVLVCGYSPDRRLAGFLPLARNQAPFLVHAGAHQAEYQVWLCEEALAALFPVAAFRKIASELPGTRLHLKYVPPSVPLNWLPEGRRERWAKYARIQEAPSPQLRLGPTCRAIESLKKKANRSRLNRLGRLGSVRLQVLRSQDQLASLFDTLITYYDLRQGAVHGNLPFREDPCKREFHLNLMEHPDLLHASVLMVGDTPAAGHIGAISRGSVQLGIICHSPLLAAHSPGKMLILLLAQQLSKEGKDALDLTPGGDDYKGRFSDHELMCYSLQLDFSARAPLRAARRILIDNAKRSLQLLGLHPTGLRATAVRAYRTLLAARRAGLAQISRALAQRVYSSSEVHYYALTAVEARDHPTSSQIQQNCLADLLLFRGSDPDFRSRSQFLSEALRRLEAGHHCFTIVEDQQLAHVSWLNRVTEPITSDVGGRVVLPEGSYTAWDAYTDPLFRGRGLHRLSLAHRLRVAAEFPDATAVFVCVRPENTASRRNIERTGFKFYGRIVRRIVFTRRSWTWIDDRNSCGLGDPHQSSTPGSSDT